MAAVRIRQTFRYLGDTDENEQEEQEGREELDEEEQEQVIEDLRMRNDKQNAQYHLVFTILPLVTAAAYVPSTLSPSASILHRLFSCLSIMSLLATAYSMYFVPLERPDRKGKKPIRSPAQHKLLVVSKKHLTAFNAGLCLFLILGSWSTLSIGEENESDYALPTSVLYYLVPAGPELQPYILIRATAVLGSIYIARRTMLSVDIGRLEELRYEYKGA